MITSLLAGGANAFAPGSIPAWEVGPFSGGAWESWRAATVELMAYALAATVMVRAFLDDRRGARRNVRPNVPLLAAVLGAILLTAGDELVFTHLDPPPYSYSKQFLIELRGVPLWIPAAWSYIFYIAVRTSTRLVADWRIRPFVDGFLALSLDLVVDPVAIATQNQWWTWTDSAGTQRIFDIPISNFLGWYAIVAGFSLGLNLGWRYVARERRGVIGTASAMTVAFAVGMIVVAVAGLWVEQGEATGIFDMSAIVVIVWLVLGAFILIRAFPFRHDLPLDLFPPAVAVGVQVVFFVFVMQAETYVESPALLLTIPMGAALTTVAYCWPYLDHILAWRSGRGDPERSPAVERAGPA